MQVFVLKRYAKIVTLVAGMLMSSGLAWAQQPTNSPMGWWLDQTGKAGIFISRCDNDLCGRIVWLRQPHDAQGKPVLDIHNETASVRGQKVCGLLMLGGFVADGPDAWKGGWIYDPASGKTYRSVMHMGADGALHVRGYVGIPLFGRSETWTRPATPLVPCTGS